MVSVKMVNIISLHIISIKTFKKHNFILKQTQDGCILTGPESVITNLKLCFPLPHFKDKAKPSA